MQVTGDSDQGPPGIDMTQLVPVESMRGDSDKDTQLLRELLEKSKNYLLGYSWCSGIRNAFFGIGVGGIFAVFLFQVESSRPNVPAFLWVVAGDIPTAYLVTDDTKTAREALDIYFELMEDWIEAVNIGGSLDSVYPVDAAPTKSNATSLASRINTLRTDILPSLGL